MELDHLPTLADELLATARAASSGRAARSIRSGRDARLRQTVMAFRAGTQLSEHLNPGEATVFVIKGSVWLKAGAEAWQGKAGDLLIVPDGMHSLEAEEDSAILFTAVKLDR